MVNIGKKSNFLDICNRVIVIGEFKVSGKAGVTGTCGRKNVGRTRYDSACCKLASVVMEVLSENL